MTVRTTMPIASRRAFVGLGAGVLAAALSASARGATPPGSIKRFWRRKFESRIRHRYSSWSGASWQSVIH